MVWGSRWNGVSGKGPPEVYCRAPREGHIWLSPAQEPRGVWEDGEHQSQSQGWVDRQEGGREGGKEPSGEAGSGAKHLPPRPLTATTNRAGLPRALSTVTFPLKKKKNTDLVIFLLPVRPGGKGMRRGKPRPLTMWRAPPPPEFAESTWQCHLASFESQAGRLQDGTDFQP